MKIRNPKSEIRSKFEAPNSKGIFHRVGKCFGLTVWGWPHVEVWFCRESIAEHSHPGQAVEVAVLFGRGLFWRVNPAASVERVKIGPSTLGRWLSIPQGWPHGFELTSRFMVFVNRTFNGRSPATNFVK